MDAQVEHETARQRFVLRLEGVEAELTYRPRGKNTLVFDHTGVPPKLQHRGLASKLAETALGWAKAEGFKVVPQCRFIEIYCERHPEWKDLLA